MKHQTQLLLTPTPSAVPSFISPLLAAYTPTTDPTTILDLSLYPEPYYGDYNNCSVVLLTHNPGSSDTRWKGIGSAFEANIRTSAAFADNYHAMAVGSAFPNRATNRFVQQITNHLHHIVNEFVSKEKSAFIRDLVPYHSGNFGNLAMNRCIPYLYNYFFNQVIEASMGSEFCKQINSKSKTTSCITFARGNAWKDPQSGLASVGWKYVGRILSNTYIYKMDVEKVLSFEGIENREYYELLQGKKIYIVVLTQARRGYLGVFLKGKNPLGPLNLGDIVHHYDLGTARIDHNAEMDIFIDTIR